MNFDISVLRFWPHQHQAIKTVLNYFDAGSSRGCLVHMPTGTGKTGVMAGLSALRSSIKPILVVCPSAALVDQLRRELGGAFFDRIGAPADLKPNLVLKLLPSTLSETLAKLAAAKGQKAIVVGTIQALRDIDASPAREKLHAAIGTIIFDEGHREPALAWGSAVRSFNVPTILFSATPFRSDLKAFDIDESHIFFLSFKDAVRDCLIRGVRLDTSDLATDSDDFVEQIIAARKKLIRDGIFNDSHKMIIRAGREEHVQELFDAFGRVKDVAASSVLALHNNFRPRTFAWGEQTSEVPRNLRSRPERYLIHQFMLTEGIDDPACTMLALYDPFENERMLVQQVGRLTRQPPPIGRKAPEAVVLARQSDDVEAMWKRFLNYDEACIQSGGRPPIRNSEKVFEDLISALPKMDYIAGRFRMRVELDDADFSEELLFPQSAIIFYVGEGFDLDVFESDVSAALQQEDR